MEYNISWKENKSLIKAISTNGTPIQNGAVSSKTAKGRSSAKKKGSVAERPIAGSQKNEGKYAVTRSDAKRPQLQLDKALTPDKTKRDLYVKRIQSPEAADDFESDDVKFINVVSNQPTLFANSKDFVALTPDDILKMTEETEYLNVYEICLRGHHIRNIPNMEKFVKLRMLDLSANFIETISCLECCPELQDLKLYDNRITMIIKLDASAELRSLQLQYNGITSVGRGLVNCRKLNVLRLDSNQLCRVDAKEFSSLEKLTYLDISNNKIEDISALNCLPNLMELLASNNRIRTVELSRCSKLHDLDVSRNRISDLSCLTPLKVLQILNVSKNAISKLEITGVFGRLEELYISHNSIKRLHCVQHQFPCLEVLDVSHNKIVTLNDVTCLGGCEVLRELVICGNPLEEHGPYSAEVTAALPYVQVLDHAATMKNIVLTNAPLMRPMSATHAISSRQVQSQLDNMDNEVQQFSSALENKFHSLRLSMNQLPLESPRSSRTFPASRCSRRTRLMEAKAFATNHFDETTAK